MVVNKQNKNNNANFKIIKSYKHMAKLVVRVQNQDGRKQQHRKELYKFNILHKSCAMEEGCYIILSPQLSFYCILAIFKVIKFRQAHHVALHLRLSYFVLLSKSRSMQLAMVTNQLTNYGWNINQTRHSILQFSSVPTTISSLIDFFPP